MLNSLMPTRPNVIVTLALVLVASPIHAQKRSVTMDDIFGKVGRAAVAPHFDWIADHTLLRFAAGNDGTLSLRSLDPVSGEHKVRELGREVLRAIQAAGGPKLDGLSEPSAFDPQAKALAYRLGNGIYIVDVESAKVTRATTSEDDERDLTFSPDGKKLAFVRNNDLYVYALNSGQTSRLTRDGSKTTLNGTLSWVYWEELYGRQDLGFWWSPDSSKIAFLQSDDSPVALSTFVDHRPSAERLVEQRYAKVGGTNPVVRVGTVELSAGAINWVSQNVEPYEYVCAVEWTSSGQVLFVTLNRPQTVAMAYLADPAGKAAKRVLKEEDPAWIDNTNQYQLVSGDKEIVWPSAVDGYRRLYRYDLDGKLMNKVTNGDWQVVDHSAGIFPAVTVLATDETSKSLYFMGLKDGHMQRNLYRVHYDGTGIERISRERGVHAVSFSPDHQVYLDAHSNIDEAPLLTVHEANGQLLRTLWKTDMAAVKNLKISREEIIAIPTADGFSMPTRIRRPVDFDPKKRYPVIMMVYGGAGAAQVADQYYTLNLKSQLLNDNGYIVVTVDPRISTLINRRMADSRKGVAMFESVRNDLIDAARWLKKQSWVAPNRIGITGWSGGGTNTINCMEFSNEFRAGISGAPNVDFSLYDACWSERMFGVLPEGLNNYDRFRLSEYAKNLRGELLLIWGSYDDNVHPQHEYQFIDACIQAGKPIQLMTYPMRKHGFTDVAAQRHLLLTQLKFWKEKL